MPQQLPQLGVLFLRSQCHCFSLSALALPVAIDYEQDDGERKGEGPVPYVATNYSSQWYGTYSLFWYLLNLVSQVFLNCLLSSLLCELCAGIYLQKVGPFYYGFFSHHLLYSSFLFCFSFKICLFKQILVFSKRENDTFMHILLVKHEEDIHVIVLSDNSFSIKDIQI